MLQTPPTILRLQRETRNVLFKVHWVHRTVISGTQPIIIPHQPIALGASSTFISCCEYCEYWSNTGGRNTANTGSI